MTGVPAPVRNDLQGALETAYTIERELGGVAARLTAGRCTQPYVTSKPPAHARPFRLPTPLLLLLFGTSQRPTPMVATRRWRYAVAA